MKKYRPFAGLYFKPAYRKLYPGQKPAAPTDRALVFQTFSATSSRASAPEFRVPRSNDFASVRARITLPPKKIPPKIRLKSINTRGKSPLFIKCLKIRISLENRKREWTITTTKKNSSTRSSDCKIRTSNRSFFFNRFRRRRVNNLPAL
jgi:hypothetical protein